MRYQCRCMARIATPDHSTRKSRECGTRRSLARKPEEYIHQPQCPRCGARRWGLDNYRRKVELPKQAKCGCGGVGLTDGSGYHLHRRGSKGCEHHILSVRERELELIQEIEEGKYR